MTRPLWRLASPADALDSRGQQRGNSANLVPHQWAKGTSGNPKGRPRGLRDLVDIVTPKAREQVWHVVRDLALAGDLSAAKILLDRTDPVRRSLEVDAVVATPPTEPPDLSLLSEEELHQLHAIAEKLDPARNGRDPGTDPNLH